MKNLKYFFFLALFSAILSCSQNADEQPLNEKSARIEVEFEGSLVCNIPSTYGGIIKPRPTIIQIEV